MSGLAEDFVGNFHFSEIVKKAANPKMFEGGA
jgi:hypothetical protein